MGMGTISGWVADKTRRCRPGSVAMNYFAIRSRGRLPVGSFLFANQSKVSLRRWFDFGARSWLPALESNSRGSMKTVLRSGFAIAILAAMTGWASAQDFSVSEIRAGVLAHSIDEKGPNGELLNFSRWEDVSFEVLFRSPDADVFRWIGSPKPNLGATFNLAGREQMAHLGLTWQVQVFETPFFVEGTIGAALHNGALDGAVYPARDLGCSLLFYESAGLGMNVADNVNVILAWEHASSANICAPNRGLTNVGIKLGYSF
jgi:lipid A 3-O-deacylase